MLDRNNAFKTLKNNHVWDVVIIGGGATGLGIALDASSRGLKTLLLEQHDFAKGTSSRSTKLVHGGVRYLAQGNIKLVLHALKERGLLLKNAPHLVKKQAFIIPCYSWFDVLQYLIGLKLYDWLAGKLSFGKSSYLSKKQVLNALPGINAKHIKGGIQYFDGTFDDARLAINIAQSAAENKATLLNYCKVTSIQKKDNVIEYVSFTDTIYNTDYMVKTKALINATGVYVDDILKLDTPSKAPLVRPSQGVHIILDKSFLNSNAALMIPKTSDGRVLFAVPWYQNVLVGTTDTPLDQSLLEPLALENEIDFILENCSKYLQKQPSKADIKSVFAGLRPLAATSGNTSSTKEISRDHKLIVSASGLITITGGKWTTYRKMAEETVDLALKTANLSAKACITKSLPIHGYTLVEDTSHLAVYGADAKNIKNLISENQLLAALLHPDFPYCAAEVIWTLRKEMVVNIEDFLARRIRILFIDAGAAIKMAPVVANIIAEEMGFDYDWRQKQVADFTLLANSYLKT